MDGAGTDGAGRGREGCRRGLKNGTAAPTNPKVTPAPCENRPRGMRTILVVDDEPRIGKIARDYLERAGFRVLTAGAGRGALARARSAKPHRIVLELAWTAV